MRSVEKVTRPFTLVFRDSFSSSAPGCPDVIATRIWRPPTGTALPWASCTWITGAGENALPLTIGLPGWVRIASCAGTPTVAVDTKVTGEP